MSKKAATRQTAPEIPLMYCGPTIPGVAKHGVLFTTPPPLLTQCAAECPAINSFVVPPHEYVHIKQEVARRGSFLYIQHRVVLEYLQGGRL